MKVLITGATGFVGKTLIPYLYTRGYREIILLVRDREKCERWFPNISIDIISTQDAWREQIINYNPDLVLHMATCFTSRCGEQDIINIVDSNILFTTLLLEALVNTDCKHFVNIGTFTEFLYGNGQFFPNNLYSASKSAVRPIIQFYQTQSKWKWINVVIYSPYGRKNESKKVIDYMIDAMEASAPVNFTKGEQVLDFIHVDDIADFFYTLFNKIDSISQRYIEFHLGTGKGHSIREVASILEDVFGKKINANWGGIPYRKLDIMHAVAPISLNLDILKWNAKISIIHGISILKAEYYGQ